MTDETVGSYKILRPIGQGGMGFVYLAEHVLIGRKAAIKLLHPELSSNQEIVGRFFNEARSTALIKHPGIVEIFDFGYHPSGAAFIVMEFLEGTTLASRIRRPPRPLVDETLVIARQIATALGAAHRQGIVHRDVKPDNIFLLPDSNAIGGVRVKVLDFGIAKLAGDLMPANGMHTRTGLLLGTP